MSEHIKMPRELTAENGAKYLMTGEFSETQVIACQVCDSGVIDDEICDECEGAGEFAVKIPVSWSTIKDIYKRAVDNLEIKDE